ncbi:hypothetical protein TCAL_11741 [Tigriopus californicus]|uniref:Uncharacterized protein n=1 Tax=Tigriopus californicus TaxID=6832 RepID=A0A553PRK6_TIGCA|nr:uncharacterized protein LOC131891475 [Tigriopus californicus]TRY80316.1 hypothetical protein TCAL_11741 [Tigriopus californicus]
MVQMFYYEHRGKCCKKIWSHNGDPLKVYLHVEESWAETAGQSYLTLRPSWWKSNRIIVSEVSGTKRRFGYGKMVDNCGKGTIWIRGHFHEKHPSKDSDPYFKLTLTSAISSEDFHLGYCLSGVLERSHQKYTPYQMTHLAFVRRREDAHPNCSASNKPTPSQNFKSMLSSTFYKNICRVYQRQM